MSKLYVIETHDQLLQLWRSQNATSLSIAHLDFHCDMRGLLIDRQAQIAYPITDFKRVDEGNFLTHAIKEGRVKSIIWAHHTPGGRQYDVGTIKYATDLTSRPLLWLLKLKGQQGISIHYEVMGFNRWAGLTGNEFLDIDWDLFASKNYPPNTLDSRVETFLNMEFGCVPNHTSVCYSPRYSHPTRNQFEIFVQRLAEKFQATIVRLPVPEATVHSIKNPGEMSLFEKYRRWFIYQFRHMHYEMTLWLRSKGIY